MPFDNPQGVIDGIHEAMSDDQGLIEVNAINNTKKVIYSIVKTKKEPSGVDYCLTLHFKYDDKFYNVTGFFTDSGRTGAKETVVYEGLRREGIVKNDFEGWTYDPYKPENKKGFLMNLSEKESFDEHFPNHPIAETRKFVKELLWQLKKGSIKEI